MARMPRARAFGVKAGRPRLFSEGLCVEPASGEGGVDTWTLASRVLIRVHAQKMVLSLAATVERRPWRVSVTDAPSAPPTVARASPATSRRAASTTSSLAGIDIAALASARSTLMGAGRSEATSSRPRDALVRREELEPDASR